MVYEFGTFFATLCHKQGIDPITKKATCREWMNSRLNKLSAESLQRLATKAPEMLNIEMYKLPSIKQLIDLNRTLEEESPLINAPYCNICNNSRWIILVDIETGKSFAARCECMKLIIRNSLFVNDFLKEERYVTHTDYCKMESALPENKTKGEKFLKRLGIKRK